MDYLNHQSTGINGLRIAASICVVLGWLSAFAGLIAALALTEKVSFLYPVLQGVVACGMLYLLAFLLRAIATIAEAAQLYYYNNTVQNVQEKQEEQEDDNEPQ